MASERRIPPLSWLLAFEAAARHKSFGLAASALGTSQPAISQRIAHLEADLNVVLFRRLPRGVQLTPEGGVLLNGLKEGLGAIEAAVDETRRRRTGGTLTVATDFGFAAFWLVPRLSSLWEAAPALDVRVVTSQTEFDIQREPIDVAIAFGSGHWPGCIAEPVIREAVVPVCSPGLLAGRTVPQTPPDLRSLPLLHLESGANTHWLDWKQWFQAVGIDTVATDQRITINNYSLVIQAALAGQGVALGWRPLVDDLLERGQLVKALDRTVVTDKGYYLVHRRTGTMAREVQLFRAWVREQLK
jgi:LysR family transcriptional regulator, glycine cleavage system transcriptional activator